jgi:dipeptide transport system ATP-binding protein
MVLSAFGAKTQFPFHVEEGEVDGSVRFRAKLQGVGDGMPAQARDRPRVLIADEPTTALDVTIQKQILDLLLDLQKERGMALILITHDMGVVAETARRVAVMYAGQVVETRPVRDLFTRPQHPYTGALLDALPERALGKRRLPTIPGVVPGIGDRPRGCLFNPRCQFAQDKCRREAVPLFPDDTGSARCFYPLQVTGGVAA